jgi:hypothetical protein
MVQRFDPEDFLVRFAFYDDLVRVLHEPLLAPVPFTLIVKRWRR